MGFNGILLGFEWYFDGKRGIFCIRDSGIQMGFGFEVSESFGSNQNFIRLLSF